MRVTGSILRKFLQTLAELQATYAEVIDVLSFDEVDLEARKREGVSGRGRRQVKREHKRTSGAERPTNVPSVFRGPGCVSSSGQVQALRRWPPRKLKGSPQLLPVMTEVGVPSGRV
jgi:hypothetical protein